MSVFAPIRPLLDTRDRREALLALTAAYMLTQLASLPIAISLPTLADAFDTSIDDTAWIVIIYLMMLGAFVMLGARLGDRYGHARVFFVGIVLSTVGSGLIALSQDLWQIVAWRAVTGLGSALVMGNDMMALGAYEAAEQLGLRIPRDISITGIDDNFFVAHTAPPLTTVHVPTLKLGREGMRMLVSGAAGAQRVSLPTRLVRRGSTAAPRQHSAQRDQPLHMYAVPVAPGALVTAVARD